METVAKVFFLCTLSSVYSYPRKAFSMDQCTNVQYKLTICLSIYWEIWICQSNNLPVECLSIHTPDSLLSRRTPRILPNHCSTKMRKEDTGGTLHLIELINNDASGSGRGVIGGGKAGSNNKMVADNSCNVM
jgi:hypothetical protein